MEATVKKTEEFIDKYLVDAPIGKGYGCFKMVRESCGVDKNRIANLIRRMPYEEYLHTRYWQLVSQQVKSDAGFRCEKCGTRWGLAVHHESYRWLGFDMYHVHELRCLCRRCHEEEHGIKAS